MSERTMNIYVTLLCYIVYFESWKWLESKQWNHSPRQHWLTLHLSNIFYVFLFVSFLLLIIILTSVSIFWIYRGLIVSVISFVFYFDFLIIFLLFCYPIYLFMCICGTKSNQRSFKCFLWNWNALKMSLYFAVKHTHTHTQIVDFCNSFFFVTSINWFEPKRKFYCFAMNKQWILCIHFTLLFCQVSQRPLAFLESKCICEYSKYFR